MRHLPLLVCIPAFVLLGCPLPKTSDGLEESDFVSISYNGFEAEDHVEDLNDYPVVFRGKESTVEYPFWNQVNGPISDALWHCGQLVLLRRSSGNPFNSKVSVLMGKLRE